MKVVAALAELKAWREALPDTGIGFVPTMGALHEGHRSLVRAARRECDHVVVSVFVNPTQFGPGEDLAGYPSDRQGDTEQLRAEGVDVTWFGDPAELYPPGFATRVEVPDLARGLCGRTRPHHFGGVALIVLKLLHLVRPQRAYFGRKDHQQLVLLRRMCRDLDLPVEVIGCPTEREESGLARSSRNHSLSAAGRAAAAVLYAGLREARACFEAGERDGPAIVMTAARRILAERKVSLEYLDLVDAESLQEIQRVAAPAVLALAARVEGVRLIDNVLLVEAGT